MIPCLHCNMKLNGLGIHIAPMNLPQLLQSSLKRSAVFFITMKVFLKQMVCALFVWSC